MFFTNLGRFTVRRRRLILVVLVDAGSAGVDAPSAIATADAIAAQLAGHPDISQVVSYWSLGNEPSLRSMNGDKAVLLARIGGSDEEIDDSYQAIQDELRAAPDGVDGRQTFVCNSVGRSQSAPTSVLGSARTWPRPKRCPCRSH